MYLEISNKGNVLTNELFIIVLASAREGYTFGGWADKWRMVHQWVIYSSNKILLVSPSRRPFTFPKLKIAVWFTHSWARRIHAFSKGSDVVDRQVAPSRIWSQLIESISLQIIVLTSTRRSKNECWKSKIVAKYVKTDVFRY